LDILLSRATENQMQIKLDKRVTVQALTSGRLQAALNKKNTQALKRKQHLEVRHAYISTLNVNFLI